MRGIQSQGVIANVKHYVRLLGSLLCRLAALPVRADWDCCFFLCLCLSRARSLSLSLPSLCLSVCLGRALSLSLQIDNNQEGALWLGGNLSSTSPAQGAGDRHSTSAIVDEQTQMELYWPPFEGAVEAGVLSVMCANNLVNGVCALRAASIYPMRT